jgi:hypothetical protein
MNHIAADSSDDGESDDDDNTIEPEHVVRHFWLPPPTTYWKESPRRRDEFRTPAFVPTWRHSVSKASIRRFFGNPAGRRYTRNCDRDERTILFSVSFQKMLSWVDTYHWGGGYVVIPQMLHDTVGLDMIPHSCLFAFFTLSLGSSSPNSACHHRLTPLPHLPQASSIDIPDFTRLRHRDELHDSRERRLLLCRELDLLPVA